jgi:hypothetical protein
MRARFLVLIASATLVASAACSASPGTTGTTSTTTTTTGQGGGTTTTTTGQGGSSSGGGGSGGTTGTGGMGTGGMGTGGMGTGGMGTGGMGTGGAAACMWVKGQNPCGPGMYCNAVGCGAGECAPIPASENGIRELVCGCDGLTYWNPSVAALHGMSWSGPQACAVGKTCGGFGGLQCPSGASCNYESPDVSWCGGADLSGVCWVMPKVCESGIGFGPNTRGCGDAQCTDACLLIKQEKVFYKDNTCPQ